MTDDRDLWADIYLEMPLAELREKAAEWDRITDDAQELLDRHGDVEGAAEQLATCTAARDLCRRILLERAEAIRKSR